PKNVVDRINLLCYGYTNLRIIKKIMKEESSLVFCLPQRRVVPAENYPVKRPGEVPSGVAG
ncbi:MAG TPA: hypothetical protein PLW51_07235, partial [Bacillota bacterium]|nr:hypothetical protein [Bacillota bacterium]